MSLTLNMVGGGGGGLSATDALLRVQAPANSTVTITKGTTTKTDLGHENADDHTVYDYYFIIHQSQFDSINPWTVTATLTGEDPVSETVIIDSADEYDVVLDYTAWLYKEGNEYTSKTGGWSFDPYTNVGNTKVAPTKGADSITINGTSTGQLCGIGTVNSIDVSRFSTLKMHISAKTGGTMTILYTKAQSAPASSGNPLASLNVTANGEQTVSMSLTGLSQQTGYVYFYKTANAATVTIDKIWLE